MRLNAFDYSCFAVLLAVELWRFAATYRVPDRVEAKGRRRDIVLLFIAGGGVGMVAGIALSFTPGDTPLQKVAVLFAAAAGYILSPKYLLDDVKELFPDWYLGFALSAALIDTVTCALTRRG
jgi:uncharacterized membrane protein YfcA